MAIFSAQQTVIEEIQHIRHHRLRSLGFQHLYQVVIGQGHVLDQDFSHNAHSGLAQVFMDGQRVKGFHNSVANLAVAETGLGVHQRIDADCLPFFVKRIR